MADAFSPEQRGRGRRGRRALSHLRSPRLGIAPKAQIARARIGWIPVVLTIAGCASVGPATVPRDRTDYVTAVADSWKEQTLLNVVRMRYGDAPSFVDVSSVISSYTFQGQVSANGQVASGQTATIPSALGMVGGAATYSDRPTITYTPLAGDRFTRSLLNPIPPSAIFELIQAGYPADTILQMTVRGINGLSNRTTLAGETRDADPDFYAVLAALRRLQLSGTVSLRIEKRGADEIGTLILSSSRSDQSKRDLDFVLSALGLVPGRDRELTLTFGALARNDKEIAVLSRSMLGVLLEVASGVDVPGGDVAAGRTGPSARRSDAPDPRDRPLIRIYSGPTPAPRAYDAVRYRDTWYWISDDDLASKRTFTFLMMFFSLAETGVAPQAPVVTIPAN
jgi:hypothetical protein